MSLDLPRGVDVEPRRPAILIVDDDQRVVELLEIAFEAHGYRILHAADGDAALDCARREHPALVVLDVRLPRRSGYEVCERLRQDPDDPHVPIVMVSAAAEVEARVQGLSRGADDYVVKPFSPRELVARVQRLITRATETREALRQGRTAERELARARAEAERSDVELRHMRRVVAGAHALTASLEGCAEPAAIGAALALAAARVTGVEAAAVLARDPGDEVSLTPLAAHGAHAARLRGLALPRDGELVRLVRGLGRVVSASEIGRLAEMGGELAPVVVAGFAAVAALVSEEGLEGLLLLGERPDAGAIEPGRLDEVVALGNAAAHALADARRLQSPLETTIALMSALAGAAGASPRADAADEAQDVIERTARALLLDGATRRRIGWAVRLGPWTVEPAGARQLETASQGDCTHEIARLRHLALAAHAHATAWADGEALPARLVALGWRAVAERESGLPPVLAWGRALADTAPDDLELRTLVRDGLRARRRREVA